jgi:hypothetical protein
VKHDPSEAVVQAGAHLDLLGRRRRHQVEHQDPPPWNTCWRTVTPGFSSSVSSRRSGPGRALARKSKAPKRSVQDLLERLFEPEPVAAALLPSRHGNRAGHYSTRRPKPS